MQGELNAVVGGEYRVNGRRVVVESIEPESSGMVWYMIKAQMECDDWSVYSVRKSRWNGVAVKV